MTTQNRRYSEIRLQLLYKKNRGLKLLLLLRYYFISRSFLLSMLLVFLCIYLTKRGRSGYRFFFPAVPVICWLAVKSRLTRDSSARK